MRLQAQLRIKTFWRRAGSMLMPHTEGLQDGIASAHFFFQKKKLLESEIRC